MSTLHLKETASSRESSNYAILPLQIYSHVMTNELFFITHHWHDELEILYIEEGEYVIHVNGIAHQAKAGEIYFINSQEIHQISAVTHKASHHAIVFDPKIIRFEWHDPSNQKYLNPVIKGKIKYPLHVNNSPIANTNIIKEFKEALTAYLHAHPSWQIVVKASLLKIIAILIDTEAMINTNLTETEGKDDEKAIMTNTIMAYIQRNYMNKITLDELAELANLSVSYFCKFFKSMFEKTAVEYINEYRIEKACLLLTQTDDKIIDIAFSVGFENFSYFIRKFKILKGMTPSKYRSNHRLAS